MADNPPPYQGQPTYQQQGYPSTVGGGYQQPYGQPGYQGTAQSTTVVVAQQPQAVHQQTIIVERRGTNHCLHFCITLFFWPWIFVWIYFCITNP